MWGIRVVGRMLAQPSVTVQVTERGVLIRVDDAADPESWQEVWLDGAKIVALAAQHVRARRAAVSIDPVDDAILETMIAAIEQRGGAR